MMRTMKKRFQRTNVFLSEKFGSKSAVNAGEEYEQLCALTDQCKKLYEEIKKRSLECVQPPGTLRDAIAFGESDWSNCPEQKLSECFSTYANVSKSGQHFTKVLNDASEAFHRLAEGRLQASEEMKTVVVAPLRATLKEDLSELSALRKETEKLRRTLEYEHKRLEKGTITESHPDYIEAKKRYEEKLSSTESAMMDFHDGEAEQLMIMDHLVNTLLTYFKDGCDVLTELQNSVRRSSENLKNNPKVYSRVENSGGSDHSTLMCRAMYDFEAQNPNELNFHEGDIITIIQQVDENWYLGSFKGVTGHFPTTYVEVIEPLA